MEKGQPKNEAIKIGTIVEEPTDENTKEHV
jgi:hypothetical protein